MTRAINHPADHYAASEAAPDMASLFRGLPVATFRYRQPGQWDWCYLDHQCEVICGFPPEQLSGGSPSWRHLIHQEDLPAIEAETESAVQNDRPFQLLYRIHHADGKPRWVCEQGRAVFDQQQRLVAIEGLLSDVTQMQWAQQEGLRAQRLAIAGELLAGIAHESHNALQRIQASVEMLEMEIESSSEAARDVTRIAKAQNDLCRLFQELQSYAAPIYLEQGNCDVRQICLTAWQKTEPQRVGREAELKLVGEAEGFCCCGDPNRLCQVFRSLFENSLAATTDPVRVQVTASGAELEGRRAIKLQISDNGPGLSQLERERAFEPFFTTKVKGSGLGLAIASRFTEAHGGTLRLADRHPGATFDLILPRNRCRYQAL